MSSDVALDDRITFDEQEERLKVTIPVQRNWLSYLLLFLYTVIFFTWLGLAIFGLREIILVFRENPDLPRSFIWLLGFMLFVGWIVWVWFGYRYIWRWWQYHLARREILYINREMFIVRRPVSILGLTDAYDMNHVSPLFVSEKYNSVGFDYGSRTILFGANLPRRDAEWLIVRLNDRYFPGWNDDEEDE